MKIAVTRPQPNRFELHFDDRTITLDGAETKSLLLELTKLLVPKARSPERSDGGLRALSNTLCTANDVGVQTLLLKADHDDVLVILKAGENDSRLCGKLYANMGERARIIAEEDLRYKYREGVGDDRVAEAITRVGRIIQELSADGNLRFDKRSG